MVRTTVASQLEKIRAARVKLEREEQKLMSRSHDKALQQIVQIATNSGLTSEQIAAALGGKSKAKGAVKAAKSAKVSVRGPSKNAGKKVAPKYRDPANATVTWTGRGRMPLWVRALEAKGELASAEIKA